MLLLIGIRFALGAGEAVIYPAANQFVARWVPEQERGFINGLIFAGVGAGSGLTPPLLAWFILHHGWRSAFWFSAIIGVVAGVVWWWFARDTPEEDPKVSPSELKTIREGIAEMNPDDDGSAPAVISWSAILRRRDLLALIVSYFGFGYTAWIFFSWFFLYMAQVRGFNLKASAMFSMLPFLSMTVGCLGGGALSDRLTRAYGLRVGRCGLASVAYLFTAVFLVLGSRVQSPQLAGVILAGGAGALYVSQSSFWSVSADIAGRSSGVFSSMVNMGAQIGGAVTASLTPWVAQRFGWTTSFAIAAALAVVGAGLWMTVHPERPLSAMMTRLLQSALLGLVLAVSALAADVRTPTQEGIVYGVADGQQLTMDYYAPKGAGPHPIAIIIHGGGYQRGNSKSGSEAYCADFLAPAGYAVFSINYRLAPKYPYPYMVYDVERAIRFLRHNASRWDGQANRIALIGGSAGGFLSNMVGLLNLPGDPSAADPVDRESAQVQAVVTLFAQSSFATVPLNADVHALLDPLIKEKGEAAALKEASPITYVHKGDPPFLQILGDKDEYIPFSEATNLDAALRKVGVSSEIIRIPGGMHGTGGWHKLPGVPDWEVQMTEWLNRTLGHQGPVGEGVRKREPALVAPPA